MKYVLPIPFIIASITICAFRPVERAIQSEINKMAGTEYQNRFKVLKVINAGELCAVFLSPPYREFPNVIIFKHDSGAYTRIIEGLTIGIDDSTSDISDLHTKGMAVDMQISQTNDYKFSSDDVKKLIEFGTDKLTPIVVYKKFIHVHYILW